MKRRHLGVVFVFVVVLGGMLFSGPLLRAYEAMLMVGELGGYSPPTPLQTRSRVSVSSLCLSGKSQHYLADLYLPEDSPRAGIVLAHGATQSGKDDERLVAFARQLAGRRFAVMVPELAGPKRLRVRAEDAQVLADAFGFLDRQPGLEGRVGLGGFSVSVGLAFLAALQPSLRDEVAFVLSVGGYHSMPRTLAYAITGTFFLDGKRHHRTPDAFGKWLFVVNNLDTLQEPADQQGLSRIAFRLMAKPDADVSAMADTLGDEGQLLLDYVTEKEPGEIEARFARLPEKVRQEVEALDLSNKPLAALRGRILLVHGYDDTIIPYAESVSLFRALGPQQAELFLIHGLAHVDSKMQRLQDAWQLWRASYALLQERDRARDNHTAPHAPQGAVNQSVARVTLSN